LRPAHERRLTPSAKLAGPHSVDPLGDHDLGMLAIADIGRCRGAEKKSRSGFADPA
jgi:hypothetical protein